MKIFIRTKSGKEYVSETDHINAQSFIRGNMTATSNNSWLNFGTVKSDNGEYDLLIRNQDIEILGFNYTKQED